ncbi:endonuclease/exonuclease/phosphatase family protein [Glycomyces xiaoerkulensis]|uniref:endonuclease/exonuclease/phosphatase family protein n=1 Tax=Glycomyces xiaoerkulensis TaxID=2038139 RepID=UPI000C25F01B|nr:endonuclease/exonuclease/phosphatase family protein [Glycomyces xiaoerkulensis]
MTRRNRIVLLGLLSLLATVLSAPVPSGPAQAQNAPISVVGNNLENLLTWGNGTCPGDYDELLEYLADSGPHGDSDLFLVQQVSASELSTYVARLESMFGHDYDSRISAVVTGDRIRACGGEKPVQRNAVIFNTDRFSYLGLNRWQAQHYVSGRCTNNEQDRTRSIEVMLHDRVNDDTVAAASVHWPTAAKNGRRCSESNAREILDEMGQPVNGRTADLKIVGGDMNIWQRHPSYGGWDEILESAGLEARSSGWTFKYASGVNRRIDYVFTTGDGGPATTVKFTAAEARDDDTDPPSCVTQNYGGCHYSEHRAIATLVYP